MSSPDNSENNAITPSDKQTTTSAGQGYQSVKKNRW